MTEHATPLGMLANVHHQPHGTVIRLYDAHFRRETQLGTRTRPYNAEAMVKTTMYGIAQARN
jgi:hypothetical protein